MIERRKLALDVAWCLARLNKHGLKVLCTCMPNICFSQHGLKFLTGHCVLNAVAENELLGLGLLLDAMDLEVCWQVDRVDKNVIVGLQDKTCNIIKLRLYTERELQCGTLGFVMWCGLLTFSALHRHCCTKG